MKIKYKKRSKITKMTKKRYAIKGKKYKRREGKYKQKITKNKEKNRG